MNNDCLFCKIIKGEIPSNKIYEDEEFLVILDAFPDVDGHALVIPKKHIEDIYEIKDEEYTKMLDIAKKEAQKLMEKLDKKSITFLMNYGDDQAIKHIHMHLLPDFSKHNKSKEKEEIYKILTEE